MDLLQERLAIKTDSLCLVVLGPSGAGKSHLIGTYPGRVLYLHGGNETHGPGAASKSNADILSVRWDKDGAGNPVPTSKYLKRIKDILALETLRKADVKCVALDSLTNLAADLMKTEQFIQKCGVTKDGSVNTFQHTPVLLEMLGGLVNRLQEHADYNNIDVVTTLDLNLVEVGADGTILESRPGIATFGVGKGLNQMFGDVLVLGRLGEERIPKFQSFASVAASSADFKTKRIVKYVEFQPRLQGVTKLPEIIDADLKELLKLKGRT